MLTRLVVSHHQANHARILALRAEAEALEAQLKASVTTLANLRHELFRTPTTTFSEDLRPVPVNELLAYAKNIASYTVPPTYRELAPPKATTEAEKEKEKEKVNGEGSGAISSNGLGTPTVAPAAAAAETGKETAEPENEALKEVTEEQAEWARKLQESGYPWTPWPGNDKIANSNLMRIQRDLLDYKKDPWQVSVEAADEDADGGAMEEDRKVEQAEEPRREQPQPAPVRRESVVARPPVEQKPKEIFQGFDFDEDDE